MKTGRHGRIGLALEALEPRVLLNGSVWSIELVSQTDAGLQADGASGTPSISASGRYVAFTSSADNLVDGDTNSVADIFVYDREADTIERVSVAGDGAQTDAASAAPVISADGRYVAFESDADNLVAGDTNGCTDVFVYDRQTGTVERVSVSTGGVQGNLDSLAPSISADGRYVAFSSSAMNLVAGDTNMVADIFVHDLQGATTERVSLADGGVQANNASETPSISGDGRYVAFTSFASNLVAGDTNGFQDVFVFDRQAQTVERVSVASDGSQGTGDTPAISADGRYVAFTTSASTLVAGDTNGVQDVFVHDRTTGETVRASVASDGTQANGRSYAPSISGDGGYVVYYSRATNLASGDTNGVSDIYLRDLTAGRTTRISVTPGGLNASGASTDAVISADGHQIAFSSLSTDLLSGADTNGVADVFAATIPGPELIAQFTSGGVTVSVYDATPTGDITASDVTVKFGKGDEISSIAIGGTGSGLGLFISGAGSVGSIKDARKGGGPVAFIVSDAPIKSLGLKSGMDGYNLNGLVVEGHAFSYDIDGDGTSTDGLALSVDGSAGKASFAGDVTGDVLVSGVDAKGLSFSGFSIKGGAFHADFVAAGGVGKMDIEGGVASSITVGGALKSFSIKDGDLSGPLSIGGAVGKLSVGGDVETGGSVVVDGDLKGLQVGGDLGAGVRLYASGTLGKLSVGGSVSGGATEDGMAQVLAGEMGSVQVGGGVSNARVLAGAWLGDDWAVGGTGADADALGAGAIKSVKVGGSVADSLIGAGLSENGGTLDLAWMDSNDGFADGSSIGSLQIGGALTSTAATGAPYGVGSHVVGKAKLGAGTDSSLVFSEV